MELEGSPRISLIAWWSRGYFRQDTPESALLRLLRPNEFTVSYREVDTWNRCILGQMVLEYKCRLLGGHFGIRSKS